MSASGNDRAGDRGGVRSVSGQLGTYLQTTEEVIGSLRAELASYRQRYEALFSERNELLTAMAKRDLSGAEAAEAMTQWQRAREDSDRLQGVQRTLEDENGRLAQRSAELSAALREERERAAAAEEEIACLEEQVHHLEAMVDFLTKQLELLKAVHR